MNEVSIKDLSVGQKVYVVDSDQRYGYQEEAIITSVGRKYFNVRLVNRYGEMRCCIQSWRNAFAVEVVSCGRNAYIYFHKQHYIDQLEWDQALFIFDKMRYGNHPELPLQQEVILALKEWGLME